jgi:hypothetical protein
MRVKTILKSDSFDNGNHMARQCAAWLCSPFRVAVSVYSGSHAVAKFYNKIYGTNSQAEFELVLNRINRII